MTSRIRIERTIKEGTYNVETGQIDGEERELLYLGDAYIDKSARPTRRDFVFDSADNQVMEVQIPLELELNEANRAEAPDYQSNDCVTVLVNETNPGIEGEKYYVHGDASSTQEWTQTLVCRFNTKQGS
jgi:hypothetical protein